MRGVLYRWRKVEWKRRLFSQKKWPNLETNQPQTPKWWINHKNNLNNNCKLICCQSGSDHERMLGWLCLENQAKGLNWPILLFSAWKLYAKHPIALGGNTGLILSGPEHAVYSSENLKQMNNLMPLLHRLQCYTKSVCLSFGEAGSKMEDTCKQPSPEDCFCNSL